MRKILARQLRRLRGAYGPTPADFRDLAESVREHYPEENANSGVSSNRTLLVTSNGAGLGHLSRLNAVSRYLSGDNLIYTLSSAYKQVQRDPGTIIYMPSYGDLGMSGRAWNPLLKAHFAAVVSAFKPDRVVFDGTYVYRGVTEVAQQHGIPLIWLRRGCWKREIQARSAQWRYPERYADYLLVPGDYGCDEPIDSEAVIPSALVSPISVISKKDLLYRDEARLQLRLPADKKLALIQIGAGVINDTNSLMRAAVEGVKSLGPDWEPVVAVNPLRGTKTDNDVFQVQQYPLARFYSAFDVAVSAAGYNAVQESVIGELPTVFVPNLKTKTDDQLRRATGMAESCLGLIALSDDDLISKIKLISNATRQEEIRYALGQTLQPNGASEAANYIQGIKLGDI